VGNSDCCRDFDTAGATTVLLEWWKNNQEVDESTALASCLMALCGLAYDEFVCASLATSACEEEIVTTLEQRMESCETVAAVSSLCLVLSNSEHSFQRLIASGVVLKLAAAVEKHMNDAATVTALADAMSPFLVDDTVAATIKFADDVDVLGPVLDALDYHSANGITTEALLGSLREMAYHESLVETLVERDVIEVLSQVQCDCATAKQHELVTTCTEIINLVMQLPSDGGF